MRFLSSKSNSSWISLEEALSHDLLGRLVGDATAINLRNFPNNFPIGIRLELKEFMDLAM